MLLTKEDGTFFRKTSVLLGWVGSKFGQCKDNYSTLHNSNTGAKSPHHTVLWSPIDQSVWSPFQNGCHFQHQSSREIAQLSWAVQYNPFQWHQGVNRSSKIFFALSRYSLIACFVCFSLESNCLCPICCGLFLLVQTFALTQSYEQRYWRLQNGQTARIKRILTLAEGGISLGCEYHLPFRRSVVCSVVVFKNPARPCQWFLLTTAPTNRFLRRSEFLHANHCTGRYERQPAGDSAPSTSERSEWPSCMCDRSQTVA